MSIVIPYDKNLARKNGSLVDPAGTVLEVETTHEDFAENFCKGKHYELYKSILEGRSFFCNHFEDFKRLYGFEGSIDDLTELASSELVERQLNLYKLWIKACTEQKTHTTLDFMTCVLRYDKVEKILTNTISTSFQSPHVRYYNYYLMDWDIQYLKPMRYNKETGLFEYIDNSILLSEDSDAEDEIDEIKKNVEYESRPLFFR